MNNYTFRHDLLTDRWVVACDGEPTPISFDRIEDAARYCSDINSLGKAAAKSPDDERLIRVCKGILADLHELRKTDSAVTLYEFLERLKTS